MTANTISWDSIRADVLADPTVKAEYDVLEAEFSTASLLIALRSASGLTQREFAKRVGMKQSQLARIESGKQVPKLETLAKLAAGAGYSIEVHFIPAKGKKTPIIKLLRIDLLDSALDGEMSSDISLYELEEQFGLKATDDSCFTEWLSDSPPVSESDKQALNRVRSNYLNLIKRRFMSEEAVKMVVLSPLLDLAGFYQPPFAIETETSIKISAEDEGVIVKGNIDVLVVQRQLWILVIESKATKFDVMTALPQALAYMLDDPKRETLGLLVNGREFVFVKLTQQDTPQYSLSKAFSILTPEQDLYDVLHLLKHIGGLISQ